jgi:hypothetical protein
MNSATGPAARELLRAQFFQWQELHPAAHLYALLDCNCPVSEDDPLHPANLPQREIKRSLTIVRRPELSGEDDLLPRLLQVRVAGESGYADEALLDALLESQLTRCASVNGSYVAVWLCAEEGPQALAEQLSSRGQAMCLPQARRRYLPWFEPHRLSLLTAEPSAQWLVQQWMTPALQWAWVDAAGNVQHGRQRTADGPGRGSISRLAWASQDRAGLARLVFIAMGKAGLQLPERAEQRVDAWLAAAQALGLLAGPPHRPAPDRGQYWRPRDASSCPHGGFERQRA